MEFRNYGSDPEMDKLVDSSNLADRVNAARQGYGLDELVWDNNEFVRLAVTMQGRQQDLETLAVIDAVQKVCERGSSARENVVHILDINNSKYSRLLDWFVNYENFGVRAAVARHGRDKDLDVLVHDKSDWVRCVVAQQGRDKDLDLLVYDERDWVRCVVAKQGRPQDLVVLANDDAPNVREVVREYKEHHPDWDKPKNVQKDKKTEIADN